MVTKQSGEEITVRGKLWTIIERRGSGYDVADVAGETDWIPDSEIATQSRLILSDDRSPSWQAVLDNPRQPTVAGMSTVAGLLAELEKLAAGFDSDANVILLDFVEAKRRELDLPAGSDSI